ncbi:Hint domain-containing protein [Tabrizicola sp.]|uniref:Hint domain-containing protein n=1 Tax=Tabrizicola sp. TaxID=2005166 RepID=UPI003F312D54
MPLFQFAFYQFSNFTFTGPAGSTSNTIGHTSGSFTLGSGATPIQITVNDDEENFHDGFQDPNVNGPPSTANNDQVLAAPITVNGVTYPAGSQIELEFAVSTNSTEGNQIVFYYVRINGVNVGVVGETADIVPGVTYNITGSNDGGTIIGTFPPGVPGFVPWDNLICFTHGTLVDTPNGPRLIETLEPGDLVSTLGNGSQPLRWTGSRHVSAVEMITNADLRPVEFDTGVIGNTRPLRVSPQHRILLDDWRAQVYFGEDQVLVPAKALVNGSTVRQTVPEAGVTYIHILFDRHEVIISEGALSESFHPGEIGLGALDEGQRRELDLLFPGLELERRRAAFPIVRMTEARALRLPG